MDKLDDLVPRNWNSKVWQYIVRSIIIRIPVQCISDVFFAAVNDFFSRPSEGWIKVIVIGSHESADRYGFTISGKWNADSVKVTSALICPTKETMGLEIGILSSDRERWMFAVIMMLIEPSWDKVNLPII